MYLDNAATSQKPQQIIDAISYAYSHFNSNIHRGVHTLSRVATEKHESARQTIAKFINARSSKEIIFTKGTTDSINMLAFCLGEKFIVEGDEIIISAMEHHSNIVPWQMLCQRKKCKLKVIPLKADLTIDIDVLKKLISHKTKLISIAHVSNVLGIENPITEVISVAHSQQIPVMIDAAQSIPHLPIDVQKLDVDFLVFSAHKMYGPTGIGVLFGKEEWLQQLPPYQGGGEMIDHVSFEGTTYSLLPYKFEAGTPNFIGSYAFSEAVNYINQIGINNISDYENQLCQYAENELLKIDGIIIYAQGLKKHGVISFNVKKIHPYDIGMLLDQQGIAVRTGHHCAEPLINLLGVPGTVRISFGLYNEKQDIDEFILDLKKSVTMLS